ncbi:MAG TPA: sugar-binding protein [Anaerolineales bacterium]|nr:sugar-binding protein [Anaerolineales bacterium]
MLLLTTACGLAGDSGGDAAATLDAAVQQTVAAQQTAGATPSPLPLPTDTPPPIPTEPPAIGVTLQWPTDTPAPTVEATNPPSPAMPVTDTAQPTATPTSVATATEVARSNGTPIHAPRLPVAPGIDGDLSEWGTLANTINQVSYRPENWTGTNDNSATFALGWDANNLYIAIAVVDDHFEQTQRNELIFKGDSTEILLDANLGGDFSDTRLSDDDFQLGLSPGNLATGDPAPQAWLWFPKSKSGVPAGATVAAKRSGEGFTLEAAIPWSLFGVTPSGGSRYGFVASASDDDKTGVAEQESLISSVGTRKLLNPTTWGTLILDP